MVRDLLDVDFKQFRQIRNGTLARLQRLDDALADWISQCLEIIGAIFVGADFCSTMLVLQPVARQPVARQSVARQSVVLFNKRENSKPNKRLRPPLLFIHCGFD